MLVHVVLPVGGRAPPSPGPCTEGMVLCAIAKSAQGARDVGSLIQRPCCNPFPENRSNTRDAFLYLFVDVVWLRIALQDVGSGPYGRSNGCCNHLPGTTSRPRHRCLDETCKNAFVHGS